MIIPFPQTFTPQVSPSYSNVVVLPVVVTCPTTDLYPPPFIDEISDGYNCTRCSGPIYYMPFKRGDIIPLQLRQADQRNTTVSSPMQGWRDSASNASGDWYVQCKLLDWDCTTVISEIVDDFCSDWWVGFDVKAGSIQTLFVDTDKLPIGQQFFRLKVNYRDAGGGIINTIYTEPFGLVQCEPTLVFTASFNGLDCLERYGSEPSAYFKAGEPSTYTPNLFYLWYRVVGDLVFEGTTNETERNDLDIVTAYTTRQNYTAKLWPVAPYAAKILAAFATTKSFAVLDQFNAQRSFSSMEDFARGIEEGYLFVPQIAISNSCRKGTFECD